MYICARGGIGRLHQPVLSMKYWMYNPIGVLMASDDPRMKVCLRCGHGWVSHVETPVRCPSCGSYRWNDEPHENVCQVCGHVWRSRSDGSGRRCPACRARPRTSLDHNGEHGMGAIDDRNEEIIGRYLMGDGCVRISIDTGLSVDTVMKTLKGVSDGGRLRMRRPPGVLTPASGAS